MSAAASPLPAGLAGASAAVPWFKAPYLGFHGWARAARRVWEWLLRPSHGGARQFRVRDWELAKALGVGRRCVQAALFFLEHVVGVIRRWRSYGHGGGRVIEITVDLAGPSERSPASAATTAAASASSPRKRAPVPNVPAIPETTPEQLAAAAAAQAGQELPEPTAEEAESARAWFRGFVDGSRRAAPREPGLKRTQEELEAQLESLRARRAAEVGPPPDHPPEPGG